MNLTLFDPLKLLKRPLVGLLSILVCPTVLLAETTDLSQGRFVMFANHWSDADEAFVQGPPPGSETACFAVGETTADGVALTLVSGAHFLWWSGETVTEFDTTWFSSDRFRESNPGQDMLAELRILFRNVDQCG